MAFLSSEDIKLKAADFFVDAGKDFDEKNLRQASYDLRVGDEIFISEKSLPLNLSRNNPMTVLKPGQFALIKTYEKIRVPDDHVAFISIRSKYKFQGLTNISGFHVDPSYEGHLIFSVQNVGPGDIRLEYKQSVFMIMWSRLTSNKIGKPRPTDTGYDRIPMDLMAKLGPKSLTMTGLKREVDKLSVTLKIFGAVAISAFIALLVLVLSTMFGG